MSIAVYAGSFDPITIGHLDIIEQAAKIFDKVVVLVASNADKLSGMFPYEDRRDMIDHSVSHLHNVESDILKGGYTVHYAERIGATALIRGLRDEADFEPEQQNFIFNNFASPGVSTIIFMARPDIAHISSSYVKKNCIGISGWTDIIGKYVPEAVKSHVQREYLYKIYRSCMSNEDNGLFLRIEEHLCNRKRHYHNESHVINMYDELTDFFRYGQLTSDNESEYWPRISAIVALFHDYHIESDTMQDGKTRYGNSAQEASANELTSTFGEACDFARTHHIRIKEIIMATAHRPEEKEYTPQAKAILDADLAILGQPQEIYNKYMAGIRKEYDFVPDEEFNIGRKKVLEGFLGREPIYQTEFFREKYESRARENLSGELGKYL